MVTTNDQGMILRSNCCTLAEQIILYMEPTGTGSNLAGDTLQKFTDGWYSIPGFLSHE